MLRFSLKEAVYKSIEPVLRRHVSYKEVEVQPHADGTASVVSRFEESATTFSSIAHWSPFTPATRVQDNTPTCGGGEVLRRDRNRDMTRKYWISCVHSFDFS